MTFALPGITNENSFFSEHYLTTLFEGHRREWERETDATAAPGLAWRQMQRLFHRCRHAQGQGDGVWSREAGEFQHALLQSLGYDRHPDRQVVTVAGQTVGIPTLARIARTEATDALWVLEVRESGGEQGWGQDPLSLVYAPALYPQTDLVLPDPHLSVRDVVAAGIFSQLQPPRWILVVSLAQIVLLDRYKWDEERLLRFDLEVVLSQPQDTAWRALTALLHRQSLVPEGEVRGMARFDEESRRHAQSVSADLKYALREAVELLGNAAVEQWMRRQRQDRQAIWTGPDGIDAPQLTRECLRYMYRLLFLLFVEAQPHLGSSALRAPVYQNGYSLEKLRNVEIQPLGDAEDTWFLHESLQTLFRFCRDGTPHRKAEVLKPDSWKHDFTMDPVGANLFDIHQTPLLDSVRIPDRVWRRIIELLSLSRPGQQGRGRISYAQLGVNQLGAVYEALLSYTGFFAQEDLFEVKRAQDDNPDVLERAWLVPQSEIERYDTEEIVYDGNEPRVYARGTFVYRLTGYGREESASYYTPETLTHSTVRYALRECPRLRTGTATDILDLRICEPAMGSAAFLIEAVNQLADLYLEKRQRELGKTIPPEEWLRERQRVRTYLTARNAFGVDINPGALELGEISLWLNSMEPGGYRPDFHRTLSVGNSLIGGQRQVIPCAQSKSRIVARSEAARTLQGLGTDRKVHEIYHFLMPVAEMVTIKGKDVGTLAVDAVVQAKDWGKEMRKPYSEAEYAVLRLLSQVIDDLWTTVAAERGIWRQHYEATLPVVYGQKSRSQVPAPIPWESEAYERLQYALDYWCSLWFWPLDKLDILPSRTQFLEDMNLILTGRKVNVMGTMDWIRQTELEAFQSGQQPSLLDLPGERVELSGLEVVMLERYPVVQEIAARERFFHWELAFADFFHQHQGFDLMVGNPPWVKLGWTEKQALAGYDPQIVIRKLSADRITRRREEILAGEERKEDFLAVARHATGGAIFCGHPRNFPILTGIQPNTYKVFLACAFRLVGSRGAIGFVHPVDYLNDPKGGALREACFVRQAWMLQFANERKRFMFTDVANRATYAIGIYTGKAEDIQFNLIANLYAPDTVEECLTHDEAGPVPGIKDDQGNWQLRGHRNRVIAVNAQTLARLGSILDPGVPAPEVRLPMVHSQTLADALIKMTQVPGRLGDLAGTYMQDRMWDETNDRKPPHPVFRRATDFYASPREMILSGPIFGLANPLAKCPRPHCKSHKDYEVIDLTVIRDDYLPRVNYTPAIPWADYRAQTRPVPWDTAIKHLDCERIIVRGYVGAASERTLQCAFLNKALAHVHVCESLAFQDPQDLVQVCTQWNSLPYDFIAKSYQVVHIFDSFTSRLPYIALPDTACHRTLQLNCLTSHNAELWNALAHRYMPLGWSGHHPSLEKEGSNHATRHWTRACVLRSDFARRQALLEIDVMVAMALDFTLEELLEIYRLVFPVMRHYENNTWYDQRGRMVWSNRTGKGMQMPRKAWEDYREMAQGTLTEEVEDNTLQDGPHRRTIEYVAPFTKPNREDDYRQAWRYFENHL